MTERVNRPERPVADRARGYADDPLHAGFPATRSGGDGPPADAAGRAPGVPEPLAFELAMSLPEFLRGGYGRRRAEWTQADSLAAGVIGAHLLLLLVLLPPGSLYLDDLRAQGYAQGQPFLEFIFGSNGTHFAPLPRTLDWLQSRVFPLEHGPAVFITVVVRLTLAVAFWRLLRRLFGSRPAVVVPLTILAFTPALVPSTAWFRQSITIVACTAAMVWALDAHVRWATTGRRANLAATLAATAVGLGCYEKAAAIPVILAAASLAMFWGQRGTSRPPGALHTSRTSVLATGALVVAFLVAYRSGPYQQDAAGGGLPSPLDVFSLATDTVGGTLIPLLLGGPWTWRYTTPYEGTPTVAAPAVAVALALATAGLLIAARRDVGRVLRAVLLLAAWVLPSATMIAYGRGGELGAVLPEAVRLWADLVPALLLAGAMAVLPWRIGAGVGHERHAPAHGAGRGSRGRGHALAAADGARLQFTTPVLATGLALVVVLSGSLVSTWNFAQRWWENPTDAWIRNARASLQNAEAFPRVVATPLPEAVMPAWVAQKFPSNAPLVLLLRSDARFHDADGSARMLDAAGNLVPIAGAQVLAQSAPTTFCVANIPGGSPTGARVPLTSSATYAPGAQVEVGLLLAEPTRIEVTVERPDGTLVSPLRWSDDELPQGPHTLRYPVPTGQSVRAVRVRTTEAVTACVTAAQVWVPL